MQLNRVSLGCSLISVWYYLVLFIKVKIVGGGSRGGSIITSMWLLSTYNVVENLNSLSEPNKVAGECICMFYLHLATIAISYVNI